MKKGSKDKYIFFLGGHDLEMMTIREILEENNQKYIDKNLKWGAKLSEYKDKLAELQPGEIPVLIELTLDIPKPKNAIIIDHHNKKESKPSSLEQIAELSNIKLNRWQQLVAANDKGYIPAMKSISATEEEIKKIREADRKAQGVTEKDEKLAEESIKKLKTEENEITVIRSLTDKFSPVTDRLYGKTNRLLIYTDEELSYYGEGKKQIVEKYEKFIEEGKAYHGGGDSGFFGLVKGKWEKHEIIKIKNEIINLTQENFYSHHIFLFPFKWEHHKKNSKSLKDKFDLAKFEKGLTEDKDKNVKWERKKFKLVKKNDKIDFSNYNEYNYFYEYVRAILYDLDEDLKTKKTEENDQLIRHFEYKIEGQLFYYIKLFGENKLFQLEIGSILLNVYGTGTAVLSFHLRNFNHSDKNDILKINKFGRRLFPPFYDLDDLSIFSKNKDNTSPEKVLLETKKSELPDAIWTSEKDYLNNINIQDIKEIIEDEKKSKRFEDFNEYKNLETVKHGTFSLPNYITGLFPTGLFFTHEKEREEEANEEKEKSFKIYLRPILDDRMYVISWYGNSELINRMNGNDKDKNTKIAGTDPKVEQGKYLFTTNDWWYSYLFVDTSPTCHDEFMKANLIKEATYTRWLEEGTIFGISRYSFVMLTSDFKDTPGFLVRHLQTLYYKMAELCLLQRATVLSYAGEVTTISNLTTPYGNENKDKNYDEKTTKRIIEDIYKFYLLFLNKINFKEVTAQEQGIEIYNLMQKQMRIAEDIKDLDREIAELHILATHLEERAQTKKMDALTVLGAIFLPFSFLIAFFALLFYPTDRIPKYIFDTSSIPNWPIITAVSLIIVVGSLFFIFLKKRLELEIKKTFFGKNKREKNE